MKIFEFCLQTNQKQNKKLQDKYKQVDKHSYKQVAKHDTIMLLNILQTTKLAILNTPPQA